MPLTVVNATTAVNATENQAKSINDFNSDINSFSAKTQRLTCKGWSNTFNFIL
jgi:hypothetical protein